MTYSEKLKDPRWQKKRLEILERDKWRCIKCNDSETELHIHHEKYNGNPWEADNKDLITICKHCHEFIESEKGSNLDIFKWKWEDDSVIMFGATDENIIIRINDPVNDYKCTFNKRDLAQDLQIWLAGKIY